MLADDSHNSQLTIVTWDLDKPNKNLYVVNIPRRYDQDDFVAFFFGFHVASKFNTVQYKISGPSMFILVKYIIL